MSINSETFSELINERVLAEWEDDTGSKTLGSLSHVNKHDSRFTLRIGFDGSQILVRFSLCVSFKSSKNPRKELFLIVPLDVLSDLSFENFKISDIGFAAATVQDAGLSSEGHIIRAQFNLAEPGYILMPSTKAKSLRPMTSTSCNILRTFQSFSRTLRFVVYIKPSDYAREGLRIICQRLHRDKLQQLHLTWSEMYQGRGAVELRWESCELGVDSPALPPYGPEESNLPPTPPAYIPPCLFPAATAPPCALVPQSPCRPPLPPSPPPGSISAGLLSDEYVGEVIPDTPAAALGPSLVDPVDHGQRDYGVAAGNPAQQQEKRRRDSPDPPPSKKRVELLGSPEPDLPAENEGSSGQNVPSPSGQLALESSPHTTFEFTRIFQTWLSRALAVNPTLHSHSRVSPCFVDLGYQGYAANVSAFRATHAAMAAIFFYDPLDDAEDDEIRAAKEFLEDMKALLGSMLNVNPLVDVLEFDRLIELGTLAREAARKGARRPTREGANGAEREVKAYNICKAGYMSFVTIMIGGMFGSMDVKLMCEQLISTVG